MMSIMKAMTNKVSPKIYAVYKGDTFVAVGTQKEICEELGWNNNNFHWRKAPSARARAKKFKNFMELVELDGKEE